MNNNNEYLVRLQEVADGVDVNGRSNNNEARNMLRRLTAVSKFLDFDSVKVIFDVGSNNLNESISFARAFPNATVYAFEASPECLDFCRANLAGKAVEHGVQDRIHLREYAINDVSGSIKFYPLDSVASLTHNTGIASKLKLIDGLNGTFLGQHWVQKEIDVPARSIADVCREENIANPDIIWMDIQGSELDALRGAGETLRDCKLIMTEAGLKPYYEGNTLINDINAYVNSMGFEEVTEVVMTHEYEVDVTYVNTKFVNRV